MVQRAAEAHGGAVFVDEPQEGWSTTFTLVIPETGEGTNGEDGEERAGEGELTGITGEGTT
jgi:hypothetical protein